METIYETYIRTLCSNCKKQKNKSMRNKKRHKRHIKVLLLHKRQRGSRI